MDKEQIQKLIDRFESINEMDDKNIRKMKFGQMLENIVNEINNRDVKIGSMLMQNSGLYKENEVLRKELIKANDIKQGKDYRIALQNSLKFIKDIVEWSEDELKDEYDRIEETLKILPDDDQPQPGDKNV